MVSLGFVICILIDGLLAWLVCMVRERGGEIVGLVLSRVMSRIL